MPLPAARATSRSRLRRARALIRLARLCRSTCSSSRLGSQRRPSMNSTVVTASTDSCVSARSGAENHAKVMTVTKPATLISASAVSRWYLACHAAPNAAAMPTAHSRANVGEKVSGCRSPTHQAPGGFTRSQKGRTAASTVTSISRAIWGCMRCVPSRRTACRAPAEHKAIKVRNSRLPLRCPNSGVCRMRPLAIGLRSTQYSAMPPSMATRLICSGTLKPCHTARSKAGSVPPTTGAAALLSTALMDHCGTVPTTRQASTSSSTGTRIQWGGSCGWRGNSLQVFGPKNTSTVKRSE